MKWFLTNLVLLAMLTVGASPVVAADKPFHTLGTGNVTGVYYPVGQAVAKVVNLRMEQNEFRLFADDSQGSIDNINRVLSGDWAFGIAQADMLYKVHNGYGPWQDHPNKNLRAIAALYPESVTIIAAEDAEIDSIMDFKGKTIGIGAHGSADQQNMIGLLSFLQFDLESDLELVEASPVDEAVLLQDNELDAYVFTVGHPNLSLIEASFGERRVEIVPFQLEFHPRLRSHMPYLLTTTIPVGYYPRLVNREDVKTIGVNAVLFTHKDTPAKEVAAILEALVADIDRFKRQHPALGQLKERDLPQSTMIPLHPGAEAVYRHLGYL